MSEPQVEFLLPGTWRYVPLADPVASKRVIARMTEEAVGRSDERATLRAEVRAQYATAADRARKAGGEAMWICSEITDGVPLPCSITAYRPPLATRRTESIDDQRAALHELLGSPADGVLEADLASGDRPAVRRAELIRGPSGDGPDAPEIETLECDYWIIQPDGRELFLLSFACGLVPLADQLTQLFDLIVTTLRWTGERTTDSPEQPTPEPAEEPVAANAG